MPMFIRYECVIDKPLNALIERLDDNTFYDTSSHQFMAADSAVGPIASMFVPLRMNVPLSGIHAATVDTSDTKQFDPSAAFGYYVYNGRVRISDLQPLVDSGAKIVITVDGQVVYSS
jgi:hypothetical protein